MLKRLSLLLAVVLGFFVAWMPSTAPVQAQTFGVNWTGFFYDNTSFTGSPVATAFYPSGLNFTWSGAPVDGLGAAITRFDALPLTQDDNFGVRFFSTQFFPSAGNYIFEGVVDDQVSIYIGGSPTPTYTSTALGAFSFTVPLTGGNVDIRVDFVDFTLEAILNFRWRLDGGVVIPTFPPPNFTPPPAYTPTPTGPVLPPGAIAQVVNVRGLSLRTGPYLGASFVGVLRPGIAYPVLAQNTDEGSGYTWYKIQNGVQVGWASGRYLLVFNGNPPVQGTVFETLGNPANTGVFATPNAFMNIRRRPSQRASLVSNVQVPWGGEVEVLGRTVQGGNNHWLLIRYQNVVGWVYAPYFRTTRGHFNQVPVY
jgi:uncharacterized protein YraI